MTVLVALVDGVATCSGTAELVTPMPTLPSAPMVIRVVLAVINANARAELVPSFSVPICATLLFHCVTTRSKSVAPGLYFGENNGL
jgi:hypothetical protein